MMAIQRVLAVPFWTAQLLTGAKSFADNGLIGSRRLNERGLHVARLRLAHRMAERRRRALAERIDPADRAAFDRDGYVVKRDFLPAEVFAAVRAQVAGWRGHGREMRQGGTTTRRIALAPRNLAAMPALRQVLQSPDWQGLIRYAWSFDAAPMAYVQTIISPGGDLADDPQCALHADTFHPTVKAWLFLTDVAADEGPFTYVPGSHKPTPGRLAWEKAQSLQAAASPDRMTRRGSLRIRAEELPGLGLAPPVALAVPANTLVVADTCGFHARGPSVRPTRRVEIWAYGRRNPFLPFVGLDAWEALRLAEYRVPLFWWFSDVLDGLGVKGRVWRGREGVSAFD